jgi:SAM-dependent methyltransferase
LPSVVEWVVDRIRPIAESAWFFDLQQELLAADLTPIHQMLRSYLAAHSPDSLLDACCGTGKFASVCDADYLGLDLNPSYVERARQRHVHLPKVRFEVANLLSYPLGKGAFHTSLLVNASHHFDDEAATRILERLAFATRSQVIIIDPAREDASLSAKALIALDQGRHIRRRADQLRLLAGAGLDVVHEETLYAGLAHLRAVICRPAAQSRAGALAAVA